MRVERKELIELVVTWLPLVVLLVAWVILMRKGNRQYREHVGEVNKINAEILAANREMLVELREIRKALEDRKV